MSERREDVRNDWLVYRPRVIRHGSVAAKLRRRVMAEEPTCYLCGKAPATEVDHKRPRCMGGTDARSNLGGICHPCHLTKSAREANHMRWHVYKIGRRKEPANDQLETGDAA